MKGSSSKGWRQRGGTKDDLWITSSEQKTLQWYLERERERERENSQLKNLSSTVTCMLISENSHLGGSEPLFQRNRKKVAIAWNISLISLQARAGRLNPPDIGASNSSISSRTWWTLVQHVTSRRSLARILRSCEQQPDDKNYLSYKTQVT